MAIPVLKESAEVTKLHDGLLECCYFCKAPTVYWHENTNNPVCPVCAAAHKVSELPDFGQAIRAAKRKRRREGGEA